MSMNIKEFMAKQGEVFAAFRVALSSESDRGCALFATAYLDQALSDLLFVSFVENKRIEKDLFDSNGPLHTFSARIKMAYYIGKLSASARRDLDLVRAIRNDFAHHPEFIDFNKPSIRDRCGRLIHTWHEPSARPRAKFTAAVSGILAMLHAETMQAVAPIEKPDAQLLEGEKARIREMMKNFDADLEAARLREENDDSA